MVINNKDPNISKLSTDKFNLLNLYSNLKNRSLGANYYKKHDNLPDIDPSYTSAKAILKNKYHEEFWAVKDPSKLT